MWKMKSAINFENFFKALLILGILSNFGCGPSGNQANVELMQDMMVGPGDKPQNYDPFFTDNPSSARIPPEHSVPVGFHPYKYGYDFDKANKENKNPLFGQRSKEVLEIGQKNYETHCMLCHGVNAHGDGPVAAKMPKTPPSLLTDKIRSWGDGGIYHVISMGQGIMGSYASHIPASQRWQVVNYIRYLQENFKDIASAEAKTESKN